MYVDMYIYIYIYIHVDIYIYIYLYICFLQTFCSHLSSFFCASNCAQMIANNHKPAVSNHKPLTSNLRKVFLSLIVDM